MEEDNSNPEKSGKRVRLEKGTSLRKTQERHWIGEGTSTGLEKARKEIG